MIKNWTAFGQAMIWLFLAILIPVSEYTNLLSVHDELVTITTTIVSCKKFDGRSPSIRFEIAESPHRLYYTYPAKLREALLQRCAQRDRVSLTYRGQHPRFGRRASYKLMGMESLTDGQVILTPADVEADEAHERCFILPVVMICLLGFWFYFMGSTATDPDHSREGKR